MGTTARTRVLFVTYEASRTGSPLLLLRFLRWLRAHGSVDAEVLCWRGGPLVEAFAAVGDTRVLAPADRRPLLEALALGAGEVGLGAVGRRLEGLRLASGLRGRTDPDVVYLNGVPSFVALPHLATGAGAGVPVLGHVHELEFALSRSLPAGQEHLLTRPDRFVAVSEAVAHNLVHCHGIARERIGVHHGFVDDTPVPAATAPATLRARLGIPTGSPVVGAVGDLIWRKGPDLFVALARALDRAGGESAPPVHLVWVGGAPGRGMWAETQHDLRAVGLTGRVHLVGEQELVADWHALFDVFVLTSREDPFPLVALEAVQAGRPVVAFDQGGAPELLTPAGDEPAGVLVPPLDVSAMAAAIAGLLADPDARAALGAAGATRVSSRYVTSAVAPRLLDEIEALR